MVYVSVSRTHIRAFNFLCFFLSDVFMISEVAAALKNMKRHNSPGLSGLVAEMIQAIVDITTQ